MSKHLPGAALVGACLSIAAGAASAQPAPADGSRQVTCTLELGYRATVSLTVAVATITAETPDVCRAWAHDLFNNRTTFSNYELLIHDRSGKLLVDDLCEPPPHLFGFGARDKATCRPEH
jgi:hypothetical protein